MRCRLAVLLLRCVAALIPAFSLFCTHSPAVNSGGGGSEVEVVGYIYLPGNEPAPSTQVKLIPFDYNPSVQSEPDDSLIDTTDSEGQYSFRNVAPGVYNILAIQLKQRTRTLITGVKADSGTITAPSGILHEPGAIRWLLLQPAQDNGYLIIPGTDIAVFAPAGSNEITIDSVPAGLIPELRYRILNDTVMVSVKNIEVNPVRTTIVSNPLWRYNRRVYLNTTNKGADVAKGVVGFPVLIRLTAERFDFTQAKSDGSDLRFMSAQGRALPHEIELWDAEKRIAAVWVKVDTVKGNDSTQFIVMHWGNSNAGSSSDGSAVFDTGTGFAGVWHLNEKGNETALDATANRFSGTAFNMINDPTPLGTIGYCRKFDGKSGYIRMDNTANSKLNFGQDDYFTVSAWVYADSLDDEYRTILSKGYRQYFLQLTIFPEKNMWQFSVFREQDHWNMSHTKATEKQWVYITGIRCGTTQYLYCNGELKGANAVFTQPLIADSLKTRNTSDDFTIGRFLTEAEFPIKGPCYFKGMIDEVRVCGTARSAEWIKLCYMNQRSDDKLIEFR